MLKEKLIDRKYQPDERRLGEDLVGRLRREMGAYHDAREARIRALTHKVDKRLGRVGKPKSHRGARRKVVILSMIDGGACPIFNSVSEAAAVLGVECNVVCGAIRRGGTVGRRLNPHPGMVELSEFCELVETLEGMLKQHAHLELFRLSASAGHFRASAQRALQRIREAGAHQIAYLDQIGGKGRVDGAKFYPDFPVKSAAQIASDRAMAPRTGYFDALGQMLLFIAPAHTRNGQDPSKPTVTTGGMFGHTTKPETAVGARNVVIPQSLNQGTHAIL